MSILRRSILAATLLGLLAFALPMRASAANQFSFHVHGYVADAYFATWTSPTLVTEVYVNTGVAIGGNQTPYTFVQADQVDFSTNPYGDLVALEYGEVPTSALNISSKLDSASLVGNIPATDLNGNPVTLSLNLSWTAIGAPTKSVSNSHFSGYGFKENSHQS